MIWKVADFLSMSWSLRSLLRPSSSYARAVTSGDRTDAEIAMLAGTSIPSWVPVSALTFDLLILYIGVDRCISNAKSLTVISDLSSTSSTVNFRGKSRILCFGFASPWWGPLIWVLWIYQFLNQWDTSSVQTLTLWFASLNQACNLSDIEMLGLPRATIALCISMPPFSATSLRSERFWFPLNCLLYLAVATIGEDITSVQSSTRKKKCVSLRFQNQIL